MTKNKERIVENLEALTKAEIIEYVRLCGMLYGTRWYTSQTHEALTVHFNHEGFSFKDILRITIRVFVILLKEKYGERRNETAKE